MHLKRYRVGARLLRLLDCPTNDDGGLAREAAEQQTQEYLARMTECQDRLHAGADQSLLVVLQGRDAGGKDGVIKRVMDAFHPLGVVVHAYRAPNAEEAAHDFLWRIHQRTPRRGQIVIFNRSHYEDYLYPAVYDTVAPELLARRIDHIRNFERLLADHGTRIVKLYLHISREEQRQRLQERLDDPQKHWKFDPNDLVDRQRWDRYTAAYEAILPATAKKHAPWYLVPADRKWFRNYLTARILADTLSDMNPQYPPSREDLSRFGPVV